MLFARPRLHLAWLLVFVPAWLHGAYTARKALELLSQSVPREVSTQVVAIFGFNGTTEPDTWSILVRNPASQTLQEYQVQNGTLKGPRTLSREEIPAGLDRPLPAGPPTVDSHDVARILDDAVILEGVQFARIDYQLYWRDKSPEPIWMATLVGSQGETLGHLFVTAMSGQVTHKAFYHNFPRLPLAPIAGSKPPTRSQATAASATPQAEAAPAAEPGTQPATIRGMFRKPATRKPTPSFLKRR